MAKNLADLNRKYEWTKMEYDALPQKYEAKKQKKLNNFIAKSNKKLLPLATKCCDKEQYATAVMEDKLMAYDIKNRLPQRKIFHKAVKGIFKALKAGEDWSQNLLDMKAETGKLKEKRDAFIGALDIDKQNYLHNNPTAYKSEYEALKNRFETELSELKQQLDTEYDLAFAEEREKLAARQKRLLDKIEKEQAAIDGRNARQKGKKDLPDDVILSVKGLKMYFGGLKAVDDLDFDVKKGEIFGLIGPNGAGKTTVFNCITQFYKPTGGELLFKTRESGTITLTDYKVHDIILKGISRTFQNVEVVKEVSVLDNLLIAATRQYSSSLVTQMLHLPLLAKEERVLRAKADKILEYMDLTTYRDRLCWGLPYGVLKKVEIARALMCNPQLIILDEPAAGLNESETASLAKLINKIREDFNCTILLVEHDMSLVMNICDHICAISFGRKLAYGTPKEVQSSKAVQEAYLGVGEE